MPAQRSIETIVAIATGAARAGIGVLRLSGPQARRIGETVLGRRLVPRRVQHGQFMDRNGEAIDDGIALYFRGPRSYTGEDVVELQAHGAPTVLARLLRRCLQLGARAARPGEFTERAFHNGKLDLAQAEAVADLIAAGSEAAARAARRSLDGEFSRRVEAVTEHLVGLRTYVEAALDFPDEDIDFLAAPELGARLQATRTALAALRADAARGQRLLDGLHVVIVGAPNAGKSSLLNALAGSERAIVTEHAGTTRDLVRETLDLEGLQITLVDTAGLRAAPDAIEAEGIRRARAELARADLALAVLDATAPDAAETLAAELAAVPRVLWLHNKADLSGDAARVEARSDGMHLWLSARTGDGLEHLRTQLHALAAGEDATAGGSFSARQRHLDALGRAAAALGAAAQRLDEEAAELAAEDLRAAQAALGEITGTFDAEQLLGRIFAGFCIGK
ncbi:MAG: tRNA uridine-5-carboxymethylaminomethyl(34) synthesis GTPase MnmE [Arenimonas sp.]